MKRWEWISSTGTALVLIAVGWAHAGCGESGPAVDPGGGTAPTTAPAEEPPSAPSGMAAEPILYADGRFSYVGFQHGPLTDLHAALSELAGDRVQLRVIAYVGSDPSAEGLVLKGETLYVFVQEPDADLMAIQGRGDRVISMVQETFPELGENYSVEVHARLPEGATVADLNPELSEACGDQNTVRTGVSLADFEPGNPDDLFQFLCDGAARLDPFFVEEGEDHLAGAWRTTDQVEE